MAMLGDRPESSDAASQETLSSGSRAANGDTAPRDVGRKAEVVPWFADADLQRFSYVGAQAPRLLGFPLAVWYEDGFWDRQLMTGDRTGVQQFRRDGRAANADFDATYHMIDASGAPVQVRELSTVTGVGDPTRARRGVFVAQGERATGDDFPNGAAAFRSHLTHELSQPIGAVLANAEAIRRYLESDPPRVAEALDALVDVLVSARHATSLIGELRGDA